jgi:hypothetical protein
MANDSHLKALRWRRSCRYDGLGIGLFKHHHAHQKLNCVLQKSRAPAAAARSVARS